MPFRNVRMNSLPPLSGVRLLAKCGRMGLPWGLDQFLDVFAAGVGVDQFGDQGRFAAGVPGRQLALLDQLRRQLGRDVVLAFGVVGLGLVDLALGDIDMDLRGVVLVELHVFRVTDGHLFGVGVLRRLGVDIRRDQRAERAEQHQDNQRTADEAQQKPNPT